MWSHNTVGTVGTAGMAELAELLLQANTANMPGSLKEEIRQFIKFAQEKVVKHQAFKAIDLNMRGQKC